MPWVTTSGYFVPERTSLPVVRRFVWQVATNLGLTRSDVDALVVVASHLVTGAIEGETSEFRVDMTRLADSVRMEVWRLDLSPEIASSDPVTNGVAPKSRGLQILEALARDWGVLPIEGGGTIVWVDVPTLRRTF
jgi:hypothetical protein